MGRRYDDQVGQMSYAATGPNAPSLEAFRDTAFRLADFESTKDDCLSIPIPLRHSTDLAGSYYLHLHWMGLHNATGDVRWVGYYAWAQTGYALPALSGWTNFDKTLNVLDTAQYKKRDDALATVAAPSNHTVSDILCVYLVRPGATDGADTYGGSVSVYLVDLHTPLLPKPSTIGTPAY